jgi:uncharacterized protein (DUF427 family)
MCVIARASRPDRSLFADVAQWASALEPARNFCLRSANMKSPGHQKWPDHQVKESHVDGAVEVRIGTEVIANSRDVIRVEEDDSPMRFYFPRSAVAAQKLEPSSTRTQCPFKGTARYFNLSINGKTLKDAVWSYEEPFDEHQALAGRLAFYEEKFPDIHVQPAP